jgi:hypothetical protein
MNLATVSQLMCGHIFNDDVTVYSPLGVFFFIQRRRGGRGRVGYVENYLKKQFSGLPNAFIPPAHLPPPPHPRIGGGGA